MIRSYDHKGLKELFEKGRTGKIDKRFHARLVEVLETLNGASHTNQLDLPGYVLHPLRQFNPWRWAIRITAQWRVTFVFDNGDAYNVDFTQYH